MHLDRYVVDVHQQLTSAAALGDERTREIAAALSSTTRAAVRLAVLDAVTATAADINATLIAEGHPGLSVRLDGDDVIVELADPPEPEPVDEADASARVSMRLSESLKLAIDEAAARAGMSVNSWLVRAATHAVNPARGGRSGGQRVTGWVTG